MRSLQHPFFLAAAILLAGATALSAQPDRLHRVLDPLGILPPPRVVLRSLDHVAHSLPPVVVVPRAHWGCGYGYGPRGGVCRVHAHGHFHHPPAPVHHRHGRPRHGW